MEILIPVLILSAIAVLCAVLLTLSSVFFAVKEDERAAAIRECLPGANCGACGYSGCDAYAKAVAEDSSVPANLCRPGGAAVAKAVADVMGVEVTESKPVTAFVHCHGDCNSNAQKEIYYGLESCAAAKMLYGGKGACTAGCLGCGDCAKACQYDAICMENGIAHVDPRKCVACGMCVKACPNKLISLIPADENVSVVTCSNHEKGVVVRKECKNGCIGCMKCQKSCPADAIHVVDNLAVVDYDKCTGCGACVGGCPVGCLELKKA